MKNILFIDRDGTLINEPEDYQIDSLEKLSYLPGMFKNMGKIANSNLFELVMVSNQDGLGTTSFPENDFWPVQNKMMEALENEGIVFDAVKIDKSFEAEQLPTRKPRTGLLNDYIRDGYSREKSYVIGDRLTDIELAYNMGIKGILINDGSLSTELSEAVYADSCVLITNSWDVITQFLLYPDQKTTVSRNTKETKITVELNLEGEGKANIATGIPFFDHMLEQIARHGNLDLNIAVNGDLEIDEHHSIEDTGITLGEAFKKALGDKAGIERYGFCLPMDDCLAQVALDFGGRNWIEWEAEFKREKVGDMPTEMFFHFFKSFSDAALCNLNIKASGENEHHKIEAIFKAFAKAIKMAKNRQTNQYSIPSTKGIL